VVEDRSSGPDLRPAGRDKGLQPPCQPTKALESKGELPPNRSIRPLFRQERAKSAAFHRLAPMHAPDAGQKLISLMVAA